MNPPVVLIVEDNPITRKLVRVTLESQGYRVVEAGEGRAAIDFVSRETPALVLQDLVLPDMDGLELVRRLRALPNAGGIPILAYSGLRSKMEYARTSRAGFTGFLYKPVEPSQLLEVVESHLQPSEQTQAHALRGKGRRVLLVQDDPVQRQIEARLLKRAGFAVSTAENGAAALELARTSPPQAILSDVLMPEMDGFQLSLAIRQDPALAGVPVVLASAAYTEASDQKLAEAAGASALVANGPPGTAIIEALLKALDGSSSPPPAQLAVAEEYTGRIWRQLERQASINASLTRCLAVREAELAILTNLTETLHAAPGLENVMEALLYRCLDAAGVSKGAVYLLQPGGRLHLEAQLGWSRSGPEGIEDPIEDGIEDLFGRRDLLEQAIEKVEFIQLSLRKQTGGSEADGDVLAKAGVEAMAIAPLSMGDERFGVLVTASSSPDAGESWAPFAKAVGAQIGQALQLGRALADMRQSQESLSRIIETLAEGLVTFDRDGRLTSVNAEAERILGTSRHRLLESTYRDLAGKASAVDGGPLLPENFPFERARRTGQAVRGAELAQERPDGSQVILSINATPLRDAQGEFAGTVSLITDVTDRKRWEKNLREHARQQAAISELGQRGLAGMDLPRLMEGAVHTAACTLKVDFCAVLEAPPAGGTGVGGSLLLRAGFGWDPGLVGQPVTSAGSGSMAGFTLLSQSPVSVDDIRQEKRFTFSPFLQERGAVSGIGVVIEGTGKPFGALAAHSRRRRSFSANEVHFMESIAHVLGVAIERKTAEDQLARQAEELGRYNAELEQFAYVAAHDLQEPLRTVASFTQLLAQRYRGRLDADADKFIDMAVSGAARMRHLIEDLLSYSRLALRPTALQRTDSASVLGQSLAALGAAIKESAAVVTTGPLPRLMADPFRLDQVFRNLIGNALKFRSAAPPRVHVWAEPADAEWIFGVRDNGIGIEPQHTERIFQIFERLHTRQSYPGTGMGLAICKKIVERSHGRIWVESEPGTGTTFYFTLPRSTTDAIASREVEAAGAPGTGPAER